MIIVYCSHPLLGAGGLSGDSWQLVTACHDEGDVWYFVSEYEKCHDIAHIIYVSFGIVGTDTIVMCKVLLWSFLDNLSDIYCTAATFKISFEICILVNLSNNEHFLLFWRWPMVTSSYLSVFCYCSILWLGFWSSGTVYYLHWCRQDLHVSDTRHWGADFFLARSTLYYHIVQVWSLRKWVIWKVRALSNGPRSIIMHA